MEIGIWNDPEHRVANIAKIKEQGTARNVEVEIRGKTGQITHILWSAEVLDVSPAKAACWVLRWTSLRKNWPKTNCSGKPPS
jgi:hypothetical protein